LLVTSLGTNQPTRVQPPTHQVLGRSEFKHLLRWRLTLRKDLKPLIEAVEGPGAAGADGGDKAAKGGKGGKGDDDDDGSDEEERDPEAKLMEEMAAVKETMEQRWVI
jgi:AdoMet-dependent rRNA methyltransferase SPB1